ncbi:hypothetical protein [Erythrobacter rubeus]|uniref:Uncharacterized protein n=1 Tax=Erythrobacter rubeus TaxID=2760803 RepID=A0ABR8KMG0_9SPHN|nr:hypothetical protein [Erythrobacter rubeus]MBD2841716.1 hypothetical protein [Erythrobacter rubeus]
MITAVLSARKRTNTGDLRAGLTLNGRSLLVWQAETVRKLGCQRFICLHEHADEGVAQLREHVEVLGGEFHAVRTHAQLIAQLHSDDLLIVMADGLVANDDICGELLTSPAGTSKGILTVPADHELARSLPEDFERIDATRNWAGIAVLQATIAQRLGELPPDGEFLSLLLRIALQARTPMVPLPVEQLDTVDWLMATSASAVDAHQRGIIEKHSPKANWTAPFDALASQIVQKAASFGLARGGMALVAGGAALLGVAGVIAWNELAGAALIVAALATFLFSLGARWERLKSAILASQNEHSKPHIIRVLCSIATTALLILAVSQEAGRLALLALPVLAIGLTTLASKDSRPLVSAFWEDRTLNLAFLAICAFGGLLTEGLAILSLAALSQVMLRTARD